MCSPPSTTIVAVDDHVRDADRELARLVVGRRGADGRGVEQHEVRREAVREHAAVAEAEACRRHPGHAVDRLLEAEQPLLAHELAEDPRVRAVRPRRRLVRDEDAIGPDHRLGMAQEGPDPVDVRPGRDLVHPQVLGEEQVADRVDGVVAGLAHDVAERPPLPRQVLRPGERPEAHGVPRPVAGEQAAPGRQLLADPRPRAAVGQPLLQRPDAAGLDPRRQHDQQPGARPLVGVQVEADVEALGPRVVDQREHLLRRPRERRPVVEVRDVDGRSAAPADLDRLAERVEEPVAQRVPHVRVVEAAELGALLGERGELGRRRVGAGRVVEARRQPEGAVLHRLPQPRALVREGALVGLDLVPADGRDPQRRVADDVGDVDRRGAVVAREVLGDGRPVEGDVGPAVEAAVQDGEVRAGPGATGTARRRCRRRR